jgi:5-deoxy-glucuronate isomerase
MRQYDARNLVVHPGASADPDVVVEVTPELAGWEHIHFQVRRLAAGASWSFATGAHELALVPLGGVVSVDSNRGQWPSVGGRANVFAGLPHALYLSRGADPRGLPPGE